MYSTTSEIEKFREHLSQTRTVSCTCPNGVHNRINNTCTHTCTCTCISIITVYNRKHYNVTNLEMRTEILRSDFSNMQ